MAEITRAQFGHWAGIPVRWGDVDRLGHVNNVQYFRYSEEARTQWFDSLAEGLSDIWSGGQGPILAAIDCHFIQQLHHPNTVEIGTRAARIGNSSMQVLQGFFIAGQDSPIATSQSRVVWFDYKNQKPATVPDALRERIRQTQPVPPQA
ncbi:MAG: acyl-CoA thioesterase [Nevskiales bacterium]